MKVEVRDYCALPKGSASRLQAILVAMVEGGAEAPCDDLLVEFMPNGTYHVTNRGTDAVNLVAFSPFQAEIAQFKADPGAYGDTAVH